MLASSLLEHGELTPSDLATLIDTFQEQKLMRVRTKKGNYCRTMHVNDNRVFDNTLPFPTINVDKLIDFAASRMSIDQQPNPCYNGKERQQTERTASQ